MITLEFCLVILSASGLILISPLILMLPSSILKSLPYMIGPSSRFVHRSSALIAAFHTCEKSKVACSNISTFVPKMTVKTSNRYDTNASDVSLLIKSSSKTNSWYCLPLTSTYAPPSIITVRATVALSVSVS